MTIIEVEKPIVDINNLVIDYGTLRAVDGITLQVYPGESVGLLGRNGAGKSSTLRVLSTSIPFTSGSISVDGLLLDDDREREMARHIIGYCPDVGGIIRTATIREHIGLTLALHGRVHLWNQALELVDRFNLTDHIDKTAAGLSHGMTRRLSVILATLSSQRLLILDEPFDGVDPTGVETALDLVEEAKESGLAVIISTHLQDILARGCDRILILFEGKIVDQGPSEEFEGAAGKERYKSLIEKLSIIT